MWRNIHSLVGLTLSVLVLVLAVSGSILATKPIVDRVQTGPVPRDVSVAQVLKKLHAENPSLNASRIKHAETQQYKLTFVDNKKQTTRAFDPTSGAFIAERKDAPLYIFMKDLHRSFTLERGGRLLAAIGGLAMAFLCVTGIALLIRRFGGLRQFFAPIQGKSAGSFHSLAGRLLFVPLLITAFTAVWMSAETFDLMPAGSKLAPMYPESLEKLDRVEPWTLQGLQDIMMADVSEIIFPFPEDWFDVWTVKTDRAYIFVDQFTGKILSRESLPLSGVIYDYIYFLHTAEGSAPWAILLLISSLSIPFFAITGVMVWLRNRRSGKGRIKHNASVATAKTLVLVGTEGGATWGFGKALHGALVAAGVPSRLSSMNDMRRSYPHVDSCFVLASTYGDGDAPKSATRFIPALKRFEATKMRHATLAFGDKAFPEFCAYAHRVDAALTEKFGAPMTPLFEIDKQSAQSFTRWGTLLSPVIGKPLELAYEPQRPKTQTLTLIGREVYGAGIDAPTAVLRFEAKRLPDHRPGDLVEIYPQNNAVPRLYSLGSSSKDDGFLEICVRKMDGGQCSTWLCELVLGDNIDVSIRRNERFQLPTRKPVVMIGAGTGIAPFTGMIRQNTNRRPLDLYWGGRHPEADWLYQSSISDWLKDERLECFEAAWSRNDPAAYVQDRLRASHPHLLERLRSGATIMVCGGQAMAAAVHSEIDILAAQLGSSVNELKRRNRYLEDVY